MARRGRAIKKTVSGEKKPSTTLYFNADTQTAIGEFQIADDFATKNTLYTLQILPAFDKLVENLIFIHGFMNSHESYDELKSDCVTFLYETLQKYDASRGTKAFSYFNVVAKNWLIIRTRQKILRNKRNVSIDNASSLARTEIEAIENYKIVPHHDEVMMKRDEMDSLKTMLTTIKSRVSNENDIQCINSIMMIFEKIDDVDLLNKKAVFLYIREMTGLTPKQLTTTISSLKKHYREIKEENESE